LSEVLPKKRRPSEVSAPPTGSPGAIGRHDFDLKIDVGFVSRVSVVTHNLHVRALSARVPIFQLAK